VVAEEVLPEASAGAAAVVVDEADGVVGTVDVVVAAGGDEA